MASNKDIIKRIIMKHMIQKEKWKGSHTELRNIKKGLPAHLVASKKGKKLIDRAIKEMVNNGWLLAKKSTGEIHVSLNTKKKGEIMKFVFPNLTFE